MYFRESDILLQDNPEYEDYIKRIDQFLGTLRKEEGQQLNIDVVGDLTRVNERVVEFLFKNYCKFGLLLERKYLRCPDEFDVIGEINTSKLSGFTEFCDICGVEHVFTKDDIVNRYSFAEPKDVIESGAVSKPKNKQLQLLTEDVQGQSERTRENVSEKVISYPRFTISNRENDIVKIATVQLDFKLSDSFPPIIIEKAKTKTKILSALKIANDNQVNIICLPELCICEEWLTDFKSQFPRMIIIAGSYYDKQNHNVCQILNESRKDIPCQIKIKPSDFESPVLTIKSRGMESGNKVYIYETKFGTFSVLICRDFGNFVSALADKVDIVFVPSYNENTERFDAKAHGHVLDHPSYIEDFEKPN